MQKFGQRLLLGKVCLKGNILAKTGLHIGGSQQAMQIGGLDLPVIKDSATTLPYIPGSSLKGKLRSTLEKFGYRLINGKKEKLVFNRNIGMSRNPVYIHCCDDISQAVDCEVCRIFGSTADDRAHSKPGKASNFPSQLFVRDSLLPPAFEEPSIVKTEVKTETGIDRESMAANPRQIERVLPNTIFCFDIVLSVEAISLRNNNRDTFSKDTLTIDLSNLLTCMEIIHNEGLGGYASRGYGKVEFSFTEFSGIALDHYRGISKRTVGLSSADGASLNDARACIEEIVDFFEKEYKNASAG